MKKSELKELIKPLVKECIEESMKEVIVESGLLSKVISEVVKGVESSTITESKKDVMNASKQYSSNDIVEEKKKVIEQIGKTSFNGINIFEGIKETIPDDITAEPLRGIASNDKGVDIAGMFDFNKAKILAQGKKRK